MRRICFFTENAAEISQQHKVFYLLTAFPRNAAPIIPASLPSFAMTISVFFASVLVYEILTNGPFEVATRALLLFVLWARGYG